MNSPSPEHAAHEHHREIPCPEVGVGWHARSSSPHPNIVGWSSEKVHVDTQFTRYRKDDTPIASYESLYVVTKEQGCWAIKMRSSFVP